MPKKKPVRQDPVAAAMRLLSHRPRSVAELKDRLLARGFDGTQVDKTVKDLTEAGYLDDEKYAALLAGSRVRNKSWGPSRIILELNRKGISKEIIRKTVVTDAEAEQATATEALTKWLRKSSVPAPLDRAASARAYRFLKARGFSGEAAFKALSKINGSAVETDEQ